MLKHLNGKKFKLFTFRLALVGVLGFIVSPLSVYASATSEESTHTEALNTSWLGKRLREEAKPLQTQKKFKENEKLEKEREEEEPLIDEREESLIRAQEFLEQSVLLHLTYHYPKRGIMVADACMNNEITPSDKRMHERCTLDFSLNGFSKISVPTDSKFLERPFCIIEPLKYLQDQLYGGNTIDLMVIGNVELSQYSSIIVPRVKLLEVEQANPEYRGRIFTYDDIETAKKESTQILLRNNYHDQIHIFCKKNREIMLLFDDPF